MGRNYESNKSAFIKCVSRSAFVKSGPRSALIKCGHGIFFYGSKFKELNMNMDMDMNMNNSCIKS
jgi:hypothetical protein